nr:heme-binding domain-containing protein [uncultured Mucilaginibacter sp.]
MRARNTVIIIGAAIIIGIQFIRPEHNVTRQTTETDINQILPLPERLKSILKRSCYDCHSNTTRYPWYAEIQPFGWWLAGHIKEGKEELNFNEFGNYSPRKQQSKLKAIANSVEDRTMPLGSYTLIHPNARLSATEKTMVITWMQNMRDSLTQIK